MVPRLAGDAWNFGDFLGPVRRRFDEGDVGAFAAAGFAENQETILFRQKKDLAVAVAAFAPFALAGFQLDAGEERAVEAVHVAVVNDEIVEIRLDGRRCPNFLGAPRAALALDMKSARTDAEPRADEHVGAED